MDGIYELVQPLPLRLSEHPRPLVPSIVVKCGHGHLASSAGCLPLTSGHVSLLDLIYRLPSRLVVQAPRRKSWLHKQLLGDRQRVTILSNAQGDQCWHTKQRVELRRAVSNSGVSRRKVQSRKSAVASCDEKVNSGMECVLCE